MAALTAGRFDPELKASRQHLDSDSGLEASGILMGALSFLPDQAFKDGTLAWPAPYRG